MELNSIQIFTDNQPGIKPEHRPMFEKLILLYLAERRTQESMPEGDESLYCFAKGERHGFQIALNCMGYSFNFTQKFLSKYWTDCVVAPSRRLDLHRLEMFSRNVAAVAAGMEH